MKIVALLFLCFLEVGQSIAQSGENIFMNVNEEATPDKWREFLKTSGQWKKDLWEFHTKRGQSLASWHWTFRCAWIKACTEQIKANWCAEEILKKALFDKALIVRDKAALGIGRFYEQTGDQEALKQLALAYEQVAQVEQQRVHLPDFVRKNILYAVLQIGGSQAREQGEHLAARDGKTKDYWRRLIKVQH